MTIVWEYALPAAGLCLSSGFVFGWMACLAWVKRRQH